MSEVSVTWHRGLVKTAVIATILALAEVFKWQLSRETMQSRVNASQRCLNLHVHDIALLFTCFWYLPTRFPSLRVSVSSCWKLHRGTHAVLRANRLFGESTRTVKLGDNPMTWVVGARNANQGVLSPTEMSIHVSLGTLYGEVPHLTERLVCTSVYNQSCSPAVWQEHDLNGPDIKSLVLEERGWLFKHNN